MNAEIVLDGINTEGWTEEEIYRAYERRREFELQSAPPKNEVSTQRIEGVEEGFDARENFQREEDYEGRRYYEATARTKTAEEIELENLPLFSRLLLEQKFMILGLISLIMVSIPFGFYINGAKQNIETVILETKGIDPALNLIKLVQLVQGHRDLTEQILTGDTSKEGLRNTKNKELIDAMSSMDSTINVNIDNMSVVKEWNTLKARWQSNSEKIKKANMNAEEALIAHDTFIDDLFFLIDMVAQHTGLVLDPKVNSYYMMRAGLYSLPSLAENLDRTAALGSDLLASKQIDPLKLSEFTSVLSLAKSGQKSGFTELQKSLDIDEKSKDALQSMATRVFNKLEKNLKTAQAEIIDKPVPSYDSENFNDDMKTLLTDLSLLNKSVLEQLNNVLQTRKETLFKQLFTVGGGIFLLALIALYISYSVSRSITGPISHLVGVMKQLAEGDSNVRSNIKALDEIGVLARQFDTMVDQREAVSAKIKEENETLNNSIINLLEAVAALAQRDLTVKAPVAEDITGPVGDALNYLSDETAKVLNKVAQIADKVAQVSLQVKAQADTVIEIAGEENREVQRSAAELNTASEVMLDIANLALSCNEAASKAIQNTDKAQDTVLSTVQGITSIRDTIRETEKRIKRLGERSQEIGSVVTIINGIAERTHILALNASMHAASAGEAGKGFAVVANEVQKLAENAREATMQIANLVNNIQSETADTVTTMNEAITQVVEGTNLAQQAGSEMRETRETTAELVELVQKIAENSKAQAETTQKIRERSMLIQKSSAETFQQLKDQGMQTEKLVQFSGNLVQSVGVFTLPKIHQELEAA